MTRRRTATLYSLGALAAIWTALAATQPEAASPLASEQATAARWVANNLDNLPTTFDAYAAEPLVVRRAIWPELTPQQQGHLWRDHIESFLKPRDELTPLQERTAAQLAVALTDHQRAYLVDVLGHLDEMFDPTRSIDERRMVAQEWCDQAQAIFEADQASIIIGEVGPYIDETAGLVAPPSSTQLKATIIGSNFLMAARVWGARYHLLPAMTLPICYCAQDSICDCGFFTCSTYFCIVQGDNCGCFKIWWCDGECTYAPE